MNASELVKQPMSIESIYNLIDSANKSKDHKTFIPHFKFVDDKTKLQLIEDGFKVYIGQWDGVVSNALIIEW